MGMQDITEEKGSGRECAGSWVDLDGMRFYKIENYDRMDDFFMTVTSSSDIWNFCWAQGGITAGRIDCDHAIFPYYTADKIADAKSYTGAYTAVRTDRGIWEPFAPLAYSAAARAKLDRGITRNIYKNTSGTAVCFEELNEEAGLSFRYTWTSSAKYGLVRRSVIENLSGRPVKVLLLDGCRNILPACVDAAFQNNNSVLLDAYKKTDLDRKSNLALFAVSSIVTDKAEPSEGLFANSCWFSTDDALIISPDAPRQFAESCLSGGAADIAGAGGATGGEDCVKGKRPAAYILRESELAAHGGPRSQDAWYQVFDVRLDHARIALLKKELADRAALTAALEADIAGTDALMDGYLSDADGFQETADAMTCAHHAENVMFNIMRGGIIANRGKILLEDFVRFVSQRNRSAVKNARHAADSARAEDGLAAYADLEQSVRNMRDSQLLRLFYEYMPLTFSRRHGDPSRPWNRFSIRLRDEAGNALLNYEGNWRDIFQNWEALAWSYPAYIKNMCSLFLNAMTADGFNPYRISREGIDWEVPDPNNPWAQIGYWGDHQVVYLLKLLEFYRKTQGGDLSASLNEKRYASANVPYRMKPYGQILADPRHSIEFDRELSRRLKERSAECGGDAKLLHDELGQVELVSLAAKLLQVVIAKAGNFVPGGGIWLNTQRPEWNDANNALAGYGLSVVTLAYLYRYLRFLEGLFAESGENRFVLPGAQADCLAALGELFARTDAEEAATDAGKRKAFTDAAGKIFEAERMQLYGGGLSQSEQAVPKAEVVGFLGAVKRHVELTVRLNRREDGLYHSYNTMRITDGAMELETLQEMLEGQVAVLSSTLLSADEALSVVAALKSSQMYEKRQNSYLLYPNRELPPFLEKNRIVPESPAEREELDALLERTGGRILSRDVNGGYHFNAEFRNAGFLRAALDQPGDGGATDGEQADRLCALYERTFNHQRFTGRSGTFYAYEGLGSIYWHMVSKLLLAVQENALRAKAEGSTASAALAAAYYDIRGGLGFNKSPALYGAFPADPYSHTPWQQGAKQPGMTGQVKEEILTRWGELGLDVQAGKATFAPSLLKASEFRADGSLRFTWCGAKVCYCLSDRAFIAVDGQRREGCSLTAGETARLFARDGSIRTIEVGITGAMA